MMEEGKPMVGKARQFMHACFVTRLRSCLRILQGTQKPLLELEMSLRQMKES